MNPADGRERNVGFNKMCLSMCMYKIIKYSLSYYIKYFRYFCKHLFYISVYMSGKDLCQETGNRRIALNLYFFTLLVYNFQTLLLFLSPVITWDKRDKHAPAPQHIQWARRKIPLKEQKIKGAKKSPLDSVWVRHNSSYSELNQENWLILWDPNSLIFKNVTLDSSLCSLPTSFGCSAF